MSQAARIRLARSVAEAIAARARVDADYYQQLVESPMETLLAAGLPVGALAEVTRELGLDDDDVRGYVLHLQAAGLTAAPVPAGDEACTEGTCWTTGCPGTCFITGISQVGATE